MSQVMRKPVFGVSKPDLTQTRLAVQPQRMVRGLKFQRIVPSCSKNKGADQLHGYHAADLSLSFFAYAKRIFSRDTTFMFYNM